MNIILIGMPAVGKSYYGKLLAEKLGYEFVDPDRVIEKTHGVFLRELIAKIGETAFIELEGDCTVEAATKDNRVIATGGSIVYNKAAMKKLQTYGLLLHLTAPLSYIEESIDPVSRGVIGIKNKSLAELYEERLPLYTKWAEESVDVTTGTENVLSALLEEISGYTK